VARFFIAPLVVLVALLLSWYVATLAHASVRNLVAVATVQ